MLTSRIAIVLGVVSLMAPTFAAAQAAQTTREERMDAALKDFQAGKPAMTASMPQVNPPSSKAHRQPKSN